MKKELIARLHYDFETTVNHEEQVEFWYARDLQRLLAIPSGEIFAEDIKKVLRKVKSENKKLSKTSEGLKNEESSI